MDAIRVNENTRVNQVSSRTQLVRSDSNLIDFFIGDNAMKEIIMWCGGRVLVDDKDYKELSKYKWYSNSRGYICGHPNGKHVYLHRYIMKPPGGMIVDHISGGKWDNRRCNLRICTYSENAHNHISPAYGTSDYMGVYLDSKLNKWTAQITKNRKAYYLGIHINEIDAAKAYDKKARELFGDFAFQNIRSIEGE